MLFAYFNEGASVINSKEYWAQREAEALKQRITDEKEYDRELKKIYDNMLDACQKEIDAFYSKYAARENIPLAEAKKRVSKADIAALERKAEKYVKDKDFSKRANEEMRLYNATMKINRLEMLKANIGLETIAGHDELEKYMAGILKGRTEDELKRQAGILGKTVKNNAQTANAIVNGSFKNPKVGNQSTFSDRIWMYQDQMRNDLGKLLQSGLIQGKNPRALAKDLKKYWYGADPKTGGGALYCMERLMRTELARVQTEAQKQSFERNGFDEYEFIANRSCCSHCQDLNGKHFKVAKMMPGENAPPLHPHCRCSVAAYSDDAEYDAWLDYLSKGGSTEEWNATGKAEWEKQQAKNNLTNSSNSNKMRMKYNSEQSVFGERFSNQTDTPEAYKEALEQRYSNGDSRAVKAFEKYVTADSVANSAYTDTPRFDADTKKVYMNYAKDAQNKRGAGATFFHEHGHLIDFMAAGSNNYDCLSIKNPRFGSLIKSDFDAYVKSVEKKFKCNQEEAYKRIKKEIQGDKYHSISDIMGGCSNNKVRNNWGHPQQFWQIPGALETESFAHMYEAMFDQEKRQYMKRYFPNAYAEFEAMIEGVI